MKFNKFLKDKRFSENKTQEQMCKSIGIAKVTYNKLENNKFYKPSFCTVKKLSKYFKISENEIRRML